MMNEKCVGGAFWEGLLPLQVGKSDWEEVAEYCYCANVEVKG